MGDLVSRTALSFDVGGTFTDFVVVDLDRGTVLRRHKVLTNARFPARGVVRGWKDLLEDQDIHAGDVEFPVHSTTLVTNAILERKGARTILLATSGFRDILELGREQMYDIYDLFAPPPEPLIPRPLRIEIVERTTANGDVLLEPQPDSVAAAIQTIKESNAESVAIAFLHSYRMPDNELAVARAVGDELPELSISISSQIAPIAGEYERTSTTAADALTKPLVRQYVSELQSALASSGVTAGLHLVLSSGEIATANTAQERPVRLLESGPAAGAIGAAFFGNLAGFNDVLSLDMGGTTAKSCVIENGRPELAQMLEVARERRFMKGSGLPIYAPVIDMIEIGAGGGSIARADELGLLKVGPDSAGADPGPACYGLGGSLPTVSDANLVLGYLNPDYFLGGDIQLSTSKARDAIRPVAEALGLSVEGAAWGIHRVVNENMAASARVHIIERNRDPRSLAIIAFGGAGPAHAVAVAQVLGSNTVVFPEGAGVASAFGALVAPIAFTAGRTYMTRLRNADWNTVEQLYSDLEKQAIVDLAGAGVRLEQVRFRRWAEMRLEGQYHELEIALPDTTLQAGSVPEIEAAFEREYVKRYGRMLENLPIETLQWRLTATGPESTVQIHRRALTTKTAAAAIKGTRQVYFPDGGFRETSIYDREHLLPGMQFEGPAILEEREATAVVWPGNLARVDEYGSIILQMNGDDEWLP